MKKLLKFLIDSIVEHPQEVEIEQETSGELISLKLKVHPDDAKIVIGKEGKTINSLRHLLKLKSFKDKKRINLELV